MATRKYTKKAKARKQRTYRKRKAPKKKKTPALSKRQEAMFFSLMAGTLNDSEE